MDGWTMGQMDEMMFNILTSFTICNAACVSFVWMKSDPFSLCMDEKWFPSTCWIGYGCKWCWLCPIIGSSSCHQLPSANNVIGVEAIVIELVLNTENWFLLLSLGFKLCSNYLYALNFLLLSFFMTVWLLSAGSQLMRFLRRRYRNFGAREKGWDLCHWVREPANNYSINEFSFPKKVVRCSSSFSLSLSLSPTHVGG